MRPVVAMAQVARAIFFAVSCTVRLRGCIEGIRVPTVPHGVEIDTFGLLSFLSNVEKFFDSVTEDAFKLLILGSLFFVIHQTGIARLKFPFSRAERLPARSNAMRAH